ncbi:MAG: hypothetical protein ACRC4Z_03975 [Fusobacteriaceae bacterium]
MKGYNKDAATADVKAIYDRLLQIFEIAKVQDIPVNIAAMQFAEERIKSIKNMKPSYVKR